MAGFEIFEKLCNIFGQGLFTLFDIMAKCVDSIALCVPKISLEVKGHQSHVPCWQNILNPYYSLSTKNHTSSSICMPRIRYAHN